MDLDLHTDSQSSNSYSILPGHSYCEVPSKNITYEVGQLVLTPRATRPSKDANTLYEVLTGSQGCHQASRAPTVIYTNFY